MNIVLFVITAIFIYLIADELIDQKIWKFIPVIMWGFSSFAVDTCIFIRMYMMLTAITVCFVYLHIKIFRYGITVRRILFVWVLIYLGSFTHYYSLIVSFWGVLFFSLYLLQKKEIKTMFIYGIGACISVGLMILSYPYVIEQATGSPTNNVGNQIMENLFNFKLWIFQLKNLSYNLLTRISYHNEISQSVGLVFITLILIMILLHIKNKSYRSVILNLKETFWLIGIFIFSFLSISYIGGEYVDPRYIYHIIPLFYLTAVIILEKLLQGRKFLYNAALIIMVFFSVSNAVYGTSKNLSSYLFRYNAEQKEKIHSYSDQKLYVIVNNVSTIVPTANLTIFELFDNIYMAKKDNIIEKNMVSNTVQEHGSCVVYIATDSYWLNGFDPDKVLNEALQNCSAEYEEIIKGNFGEFYYIYEL